MIALIKQGWTPEQIGNRMIYESAKLRICQETIYRYIYSMRYRLSLRELSPDKHESMPNLGCH